MDIRTLAENGTITSRDGTTIAFSKLGRGPSIILVDGAFCFRQNGPTPALAPLLARRFTVFAYDRRGRGESDNASRTYGIEQEVDDLNAILEAAGGSAYVFGMSSGAGIVLRAAEQGGGITKLALYEPPFITTDGRPRQLDTARADLERLTAAGRRSDAVMYFMTEVFGAPRFFIHGMKVFMRSTWKKNESVAHTLPYDLAILSDWSALSAASSIKVPALVIGGAKSPAQLREAIGTVSDAIPGARRQLLEGQSHNIEMSVLAPVLEKFFLSN